MILSAWSSREPDEDFSSGRVHPEKTIIIKLSGTSKPLKNVGLKAVFSLLTHIGYAKYMPISSIKYNSLIYSELEIYH